MSKSNKIITQIYLTSALLTLSMGGVQAATNSEVAEDPTITGIAQSTPAPLVPNPPITIDGNPVTPGVGLITPTQPRAVAPPVGDISISNIDASIPAINLNSNVRIPKLVVKDAPAREVLELLSRSAGLNLAYSGPGKNDKGESLPEPTITLNLQNEPIQNAFNYVLQMSGYEGNRVGNTIFVGAKLPDALNENIIRSLRLNQVSATSAANFLTSQGAETQFTTEKIEIETIGNQASEITGRSEGSTSRTVERRTPEIKLLKATKGSAPLLLNGLAVSPDTRLNSITLIGSPRKVEIATALLTRLDARRRQVALNVKIVDVNLSNTNDSSSSFSFKVGENYLSVDNGAAVYNYGGYNPPNKATVLGSPVVSPVSLLTLPSAPSGTATVGQVGPFVVTPAGSITGGPGYTSNQTNGARAPFGSTDSPFQPGITSIDKEGQVTYGLPGFFQYPSKFLATLQSQIVSGNGKILTDPTLVVQEGQRSQVKLVEEVFGGFELQQSSTSAATNLTSRKPIIKEAGLVLDLLVNRIDDNGFISVSVAPEVSSLSGTSRTADGDIALVQRRQMNSGEIRLRDGQTLILSGIIQERDRTSVTKVPVLGDLPIIGSLFRSTNRSNQRQEVIVLLTPQIIDDSKTQVNYTPGIDARLMLNQNR